MFITNHVTSIYGHIYIYIVIAGEIYLVLNEFSKSFSEEHVASHGVVFVLVFPAGRDASVDGSTDFLISKDIP